MAGLCVTGDERREESRSTKEKKEGWGRGVVVKSEQRVLGLASQKSANNKNDAMNAVSDSPGELHAGEVVNTFDWTRSTLPFLLRHPSLSLLRLKDLA
ncbi:hypothetical protein B296_00027401 [Ensete ventricosum]|uniref:Uncharacterized protein n=1 Tax=Ensete ventricosum TaxID=4639 RepID=A0A426ZLM9_ENSVE|nr:hypothetical protein B296_00027401 [Ensete ventricosum]